MYGSAELVGPTAAQFSLQQSSQLHGAMQAAGQDFMRAGQLIQAKNQQDLNNRLNMFLPVLKDNYGGDYVRMAQDPAGQAMLKFAMQGVVPPQEMDKMVSTLKSGNESAQQIQNVIRDAVANHQIAYGQQQQQQQTQPPQQQPNPQQPTQQQASYTRPQQQPAQPQQPIQMPPQYPPSGQYITPDQTTGTPTNTSLGANVNPPMQGGARLNPGQGGTYPSAPPANASGMVVDPYTGSLQQSQGTAPAPVAPIAGTAGAQQQTQQPPDAISGAAPAQQSQPNQQPAVAQTQNSQGPSSNVDPQGFRDWLVNTWRDPKTGKVGFPQVSPNGTSDLTKVPGNARLVRQYEAYKSGDPNWFQVHDNTAGDTFVNKFKQTQDPTVQANTPVSTLPGKSAPLANVGALKSAIANVAAGVASNKDRSEVVTTLSRMSSFYKTEAAKQKYGSTDFGNYLSQIVTYANVQIPTGIDANGNVTSTTAQGILAWMTSPGGNGTAKASAMADYQEFQQKEKLFGPKYAKAVSDANKSAADAIVAQSKASDALSVASTNPNYAKDLAAAKLNSEQALGSYRWAAAGKALQEKMSSKDQVTLAGLNTAINNMEKSTDPKTAGWFIFKHPPTPQDIIAARKKLADISPEYKKLLETRNALLSKYGAPSSLAEIAAPTPGSGETPSSPTGETPTNVPTQGGTSSIPGADQSLTSKYSSGNF